MKSRRHSMVLASETGASPPPSILGGSHPAPGLVHSAGQTGGSLLHATSLSMGPGALVGGRGPREAALPIVPEPLR